MKVLRLVLNIGPTSAPYNQFTLPVLGEHDVTLCTYFPSDWRADPRLEYCQGDGRTTSFLRRLRALLKQRQFDIVHIHSPHLGLMFLAVALVTRPTLLGRTILHLHSSYSVYRCRNRWMLLPGFAAFGRLVCCGYASFESFPRLFRRLAGRRLVAIRNGVDLVRVDTVAVRTRRLFFTGAETLELITVGHLRALKNHRTIIRALAEARTANARLTIIGDGPCREPLTRLAAELEVADRVTFLGRVSRNETLKHLWRADAFVSASRGEGLPVAVLEALACRCPAILSDIPPHREIREGREDLIPLVGVDDVNQLAQYIDVLARTPVEIRRGWGADCRQHVEQRFSLYRMLDEIDELYEQLNPPITLEWELFERCVRGKAKRRKAA